MTLFFAIAGFFARMLFHRRGRRQFWKDRAKRILVPLVIGWFALMPLIVAAMSWGASRSGNAFPPVAPPDTVAPFPWAHLWFLYVLWWFYVLFVGARALLNSVPGHADRLRKIADALTDWLTRVPLAGYLVRSTPIGALLNGRRYPFERLSPRSRA
jgi:glucan biosynthesis protein C